MTRYMVVDAFKKSTTMAGMPLSGMNWMPERHGC